MRCGMTGSVRPMSMEAGGSRGRRDRPATPRGVPRTGAARGRVGAYPQCAGGRGQARATRGVRDLRRGHQRSTGTSCSPWVATWSPPRCGSSSATACSALDERVADVIGEFGTNGKDVVTLEQVLTHTAGFPFAPLGYPKMLDRQTRLEAFGRWRLDFEPGSSPSVPSHLGRVGHRRAGGAPHGRGVRRVSADRDRRASRTRLHPPAAGGAVRSGTGRPHGHRPDERRPGGGPLGSLVPGQPRRPGGRRAQPLHRRGRRRTWRCCPRPSSIRACGIRPRSTTPCVSAGPNHPTENSCTGAAPRSPTSGCSLW